MTVDLAVQFHDDDLMAYNTVAEISGSDLKDEIVMLGGHMDSWHERHRRPPTTGPASRSPWRPCVILQAAPISSPGVRFGSLPSGAARKRGALGLARVPVKDHFGKSPASGMFGPPTGAPNGGAGAVAREASDSSPKPEFDKFSAYFNLDNGTGKVRGVYLQGNDAVRPIFRKWLVPFRDMGATTLTISNTGGTDHQSFDGIGLPGFQFIQDEIEYDTRTHHTNQDVFDRIQPPTT